MEFVENVVEETKPSNKKKQIIIISVLCAVLFICLTLMLLLTQCSRPKTELPLAANLSVRTSLYDSSGEKSWVQNDFIFLTSDQSKQIDTSPTRFGIDSHEYIKHTYTLENTTLSNTSFAIEFKDLTNENCSIVYRINGQEEKEFTNIITGEAAASATTEISIYIRIADIDLPALFNAKIYFTFNF